MQYNLSDAIIRRNVSFNIIHCLMKYNTLFNAM